MPCAAGELCQLPDRTPVAPDGHVYQGGCGGRLHGSCGEMAEDNENHRICGACFDAKSRKRKGTHEEGGGAGEAKRAKTGKVNGGPRKRLTLNQKLEIFKLLEERTTHDEIADRYGCSDRTVCQIKANKDSLGVGGKPSRQGWRKDQASGRFS